MSKSFKIVAFADSSNAQQTDYIEKQVDAIKNLFPEVTFELQNELCPLLKQYSKHCRVPCYMVFKNDIYKSHKLGKLNNDQAINWIKLTTS